MLFLMVFVVTGLSATNCILDKRDIEKSTHTYKTVGDVQIQADLYQVQDQNVLSPVIIWIHGGALIWGSRNDLPEEQLTFYLNAGFTVVSIDYRLAPETKLDEIVTDVADAISWVRHNGKESLGIDPEQIFMIGHSAGGYLALLSGSVLCSPPQRIISFYGYGDILADWYTKPDPFYCTWDKVHEQEAFSQITDSVITSAEAENRFNFYLYCRQNGKWPEMVSGLNPTEISELAGYCPIHNIDMTFPPTMLIHGDKDTDVPYAQSEMFANALNSKQVNNRFITMNGFGHAFDTDEGGLERKKIRVIFNEITDFLKINGVSVPD